MGFKGITLSLADRPSGKCLPANPGGPGVCTQHPAGGHGAAAGEGGGEEAAAAPRGRGQEAGETPDVNMCRSRNSTSYILCLGGKQAARATRSLGAKNGGVLTGLWGEASVLLC